MNEIDSKTSRKKMAHQMQQLGVQISALQQHEWETMGLDASIQNAMLEYRRLNKSAKRRQAQYLGKLLRRYDYDQLNGYFAEKEKQHRLRASLSNKIPMLAEQLVAKEIQPKELLVFFPDLNIADVEKTLLRLKANNETATSNRVKKDIRKLLLDELKRRLEG